jgi:hypothetical protein
VKLASKLFLRPLAHKSTVYPSSALDFTQVSIIREYFSRTIFWLFLDYFLCHSVLYLWPIPQVRFILEHNLWIIQVGLRSMHTFLGNLDFISTHLSTKFTLPTILWCTEEGSFTQTYKLSSTQDFQGNIG